MNTRRLAPKPRLGVGNMVRHPNGEAIVTSLHYYAGYADSVPWDWPADLGPVTVAFDDGTAWPLSDVSPRAVRVYTEQEIADVLSRVDG